MDRIPLSTSSRTSKRGTKHLSRQKKIFDPQGPFIQKLNKIFLVACFFALALDPLFFYIPLIDGSNMCLDLDPKIKITACVLRSAIDIFYIFHIVLRFRTGFIAPSTRVFGREELVDDPRVISRRYLSSYFIVDILAILPIPQLIVLVIAASIDGPIALFTKEFLMFAVLIQYVPRIIRIFPLRQEVTRTSSILTLNVWAGVAGTFLLYMLAIHAVGSFWYLFSIQRMYACWRRECHKRNSCNSLALYCNVARFGDYGFLNSSCALKNPEDIISDSTFFDFGIYFDALQSGVLESKDLSYKLMYCSLWGMRNLSSLGQNLKTSNHKLEMAFAMSISIAGAVLFSVLLGNVAQKLLQSTHAVRVEEMRVKQQEVELWMSQSMLPEELRERIRRYEQYKWLKTRGVEGEQLIRNLPKDLRRDIKRHLCLHLLRRVPLFGNLDEQLLDAICARLEPVLYIECSYIIREGDPVDEMLFIIRGRLETMTTARGRTRFFYSAGDFFGEELLMWAMGPHSASNLPSSTRTVRALTEVEAFKLMADDLKFVASKFPQLNSKQLQHIFRFYSQQWRRWAAYFIQGAWRRYRQRKEKKALREAEGRVQDALARETAMAPSLGATIYASRLTPRLRARRGHQPQPLNATQITSTIVAKANLTKSSSM